MVHQNTGYQWAKPRKHAAFVMQMRLGKTLLCIRWLFWKSRKKPREMTPGLFPILVLAPLATLEAWERELDAENELYCPAYGLTPAKRVQAVEWAFEPSCNRRWLLMNYDAIRSIPEVANLEWFGVILDESPKIRNPKAEITKIICGEARTKKYTDAKGRSRRRRLPRTLGFGLAKHRAILTGLITPESPLDVFQQFKFLYGSFMGSKDYWQFRAREFEAGWTGYDYEPKPGVLDKIKNEVHTKGFVLRRTDVSIGSRKIYERRYVSMTPAQKRLYAEMEKNFAYTNSAGELIEINLAINLQNWLMHVAGGFTPERVLLNAAKSADIIDLLTGELLEEQAVIWFRYRHELVHVREALEASGLSSVSILGGTPQIERQERIRAFRNDQSIRVMLATEKCAQYGIDASTASVCGYYSNEWACEARAQSEDRILHPMKTEPLLYIDWVTRGTVDEDICDIVQDKTLTAQMFMVRLNDILRKRGLVND